MAKLTNLRTESGKLKAKIAFVFASGTGGVTEIKLSDLLDQIDKNIPGRTPVPGQYGDFLFKVKRISFGHQTGTASEALNTPFDVMVMGRVMRAFPIPQRFGDASVHYVPEEGE